MDDIIRTSGLTYAYKTVSGEVPKIILSGIDLAVETGEFVAVLGCNGSGKSTLAKHFNAMLLPVGGKVWISDMDTADEKLLLQIRSTVGMVFQNPDNQIVATVVEDDVAFAPENLGLPSEEIRERVDNALKIVGMYDYRSHAPHLLSGGQKQRVAIAGVLAMKPRCIVFDEPTAMLDPRGRASVVEVIRRLRDEYGETVILITHHMEETIDADRIVVMAQGDIVMQGAPREVFRQVDKLRELGLDVPETVSLLDELNGSGFELPLDALSIDECARAIYKSITTAK